MLISKPHIIKKYYQALIDRKEDHVGVFYAGVKTTSVFCISTCRARKPKFENVVFYTEFKDALDNGFRPCKICKPTQNANQAPDDVVRVIEMVKQNPKSKIKDYALRQMGIKPEAIRRWFKKNYGITFHAYQRMYRINNAYQELKHGNKTSETAFKMGYDSLSGFGYTYKKLMGDSPDNSKDTSIIHIQRLTTPLGPMFVCATEKGICLLEFVDRRMLETEFKDLQALLNAKIMIGENVHLIQVRREIEEYFAGERQKFNVALHTPGSVFQNRVWSALLDVSYGTTSTYQRQAEIIENPKAVRAVARANGFNRISIIVPCHRIIGSDGSLRGYGGGLERKQWLLDHEKKNLLSTA